MSYLRTNYRLTGGKINLAAPKSMDSPGAIGFAYAGGGSGRIVILFQDPGVGAGTYVGVAFSTAIALSVGDL